MISISFFVAFISVHSVFSCITIPPCQKDGEPCGSVGSLSSRCCDGLDCAAVSNPLPPIPGMPTVGFCAPTSSKKKRSTGTNCGEVEKIEKAAFVVCETDGDNGLTWGEVAACEEKYANFGVPHPTRTDFDNFDLNGDGTLMFDE